MVQYIPKKITKDENNEIERMPTKEEVKHVVFNLNEVCASGQDGY